MQTSRCGEVEFGFASSVFNFFVVFENILLQGHVQTPLKKVVFDSNATFLSKHHGFLVGFGLSSVIWSTHLGGEWWYEATPPDLYQIYKICSEWKSSLAWVNLSSGSSPAAMTTAMSAERRSGSPGNKIKKLFSFYRNPPSFGSPNSFRINPIGFFRRPMPNILIFIKLFNQMFNRNLFWALNTNRKLSLQNIITFVFMITTLREYKVPLCLSLTLSAVESFICTTSLQAGRYLWTQQKWSTCDNGISAGLGSCSSCWDGKRNMIYQHICWRKKLFK